MPTPKIFVGGLPKMCDESILMQYFSNFGVVTNIEVKRGNDGTPRGFAFVSFATYESVSAALALYDSHEISGKWVEVKQAQEQGHEVAEGPSRTSGGMVNMMGSAKTYGKGGKGKGYMDRPSMRSFASMTALGNGLSPGSMGMSGIGLGGISLGSRFGPGAAFTAGLKSMMGKGKGSAKGLKANGPKGHEHNAAKIFVGGLPKAIGEDELRQYFENFGTIAEIDLKMNPLTGESRGFGFITFEDPESAKATLAMYDDHMLQDKWIEVKSAMANGQPAPGQKGAGKGGVPATEPCKLFVGGLPPTVDEDEVIEYFSTFGEISECLLKKDESGKLRGFGFITFTTEEGAVECINNYANNTIKGKWVEVKSAMVKGEQKGSKGKMKGGMGMGGMDMDMMDMGMGLGGMGMSMGHSLRYKPY